MTLPADRAFGFDSYGEFVNNVHLGSGNLVERATDASVASVGPDLELTRTYNSLDTTVGLFGEGWSSPFDVRAEFISPTGEVRIVYADGRRETHTANGDGTYKAPTGYVSRLVDRPGGVGGWTLHHKDKTVWNFDSSGRLIGMEDAYGRALTLNYSGSELTSVVDDDSGRRLTFTYDSGKISSVATDAVTGPGYDGPLVWRYAYFGDLLTAVCDPRDNNLETGSCTRYGYTDERLTSITRPRGNVSFEASYGADGKVAWTENGTNDRVLYTYGAGITQVTNARGFKSTYFFDPLYRTTQVVDPLLGSTVYEYDANGFRSRITDPNGNVASLTYDARGNLTSETNGEGERTFRIYDTSDNLTARRDGRTVDLSDTRFETTYSYNPQGDRETETSPHTAEYPSGITQTWSYTDGTEDVGWGVVPPGLLKASNPGGGTDTRYEYDSQGDLRRRFDPSGLETTFEHDTLGRVISTTVTWEDGSSTTTQAYDQLGNVLSVLEPAVTNTAGATAVTHRRETVHTYDPNSNRLSTTVRDVDPARQTPGSQPFAFTGAPEAFPVPAGVTSLTVDLAGAEGGDGIPTTGGGQGGRGGRVQATLTVTPGEILQVRVGGVGGTTAAAQQAGGAGGFYGGAAGGAGATGLNAGGGGGGGASDIRRGGTTDADRVLVAGGGGGGSNNSSPAGPGGAALDSRSTAASAAIAGANATGTANGGGGGGGGWRGGPGGQANPNPSGGGGGTNMADGAVTSAVTSTADYQAGSGFVTFSWVVSTGPDAGLNRTTTYEYDPADREIKVIDPELGETSRSFDPNGNVATTTDAEGRVFRTTYDDADRRTRLLLEGFVDDPTGGGSTPRDVVVSRWSYDSAGRVVSILEPAPGTGGLPGQMSPSTPVRQTNRAYDRADRVVSVTLVGFDNRPGLSPATRDVVLEANTYDDAGNVTVHTVGGGKAQTTNYFDEASRLQTASLEMGDVDRAADFDYNAVGNPTRQTVNEGSSVTETRRVYDGAFRLASEIVENGAADLTTAYHYDRRGLRVGVTDPRGSRTDNAYDALGQLTQTLAPEVSIEAVGGTSTAQRPTVVYGYDFAGNRTHVVDARGNRTTTSYDRLNRAVRVDHPTYTPPSGQALSPYETFTFDRVGNLVARRDRRGEVTEFTFDARNRVVRQLDPQVAGSSARGATRYLYDDAGFRTQVTDPTGAVARSSYDDLGRVRTQTAVVRQEPVVGEYTTTFDYDDLGNRTYVDDPTGATTSTVYDAASQAVAVVDELDATTVYQYGADGRVLSTVDPVGRVVEHGHDMAGREISTTWRASTGGPALATTYATYDAGGNRTESRSARSASDTDDTYLTTVAYDALGRVTTITQPDATAPMVTAYGYDAAGNVTRVTDGNGNVTTYTFTPWNQPASTVEPSVTGQTVLADRTYTTTYDGGGLPVRDVQPGGITVDRAFDELGRLSSESGAGGGTGAATRAFGYDLAGRRTSISHPGGTVTFAYDDRGLVLASSLPGSATAAAAFDYDDAGRMNLRSDGAGESTFTYTARGELDHVTDPLTGAVTDYDFNDAGQVSTVRYGGATPATRGLTYDGQGRLDVDTLTPTAGSALVYDYGYDPDGNLTSQDVAAAGNPAAGTNSYTYDRSGRLDTWTGPAGGVTDYGYDPAGNRTTAGSTAYTYDARNRLTGATNPAGSTVNTWTPRGTMATSTLHPVQFRVGLVVGDPGALTAADTAIMGRLTAAGHTVALVDDTAPAVGGVSLVVVAESVDELSVNAKYRGYPGGVLYLDPGLWDDDGLATTPGTPLATNANKVMTPGHPAVAGRTGIVTTTTTGDHAGVADSALGAGATQLLDRESFVSVNVEFAYDVGANRALFGPAPGRRIALGWTSNALTSLTADGGAIFDATVRWAGGAPVVTASTFDALGRQTAVAASTFAFDGLDRVASRDADGVGPLAPVGFSYAAGEIDPVSWGDQAYARTPAGELAAVQTPAGARLAVENRHGDLTALLDPTGAVTDTDIYDPYGTPVGQTGTTDPAVGYQGDWTDPTSNQVWMGARWYQPATATFTARDTVFGQLATPMTLNRYTYANGDPLQYFDPDGRYACTTSRFAPDGGCGTGKYRHVTPGGGSRDDDKARVKRQRERMRAANRVSTANNEAVRARRQTNERTRTRLAAAENLVARMDAPQRRAAINWDELRCEENCASVNRQVDRTLASCLGGVSGFVRGVLNRCGDRRSTERRILQGPRDAFFEDHPIYERFRDIAAQVVVAAATVGAQNRLYGRQTPRDGARLSPDNALDAAEDFLREGYRPVTNDRYLSADGLRQIRWDLEGHNWNPSAGTGTPPHLNFETRGPVTPSGRQPIIENRHIFIVE